MSDEEKAKKVEEKKRCQIKKNPTRGLAEDEPQTTTRQTLEESETQPKMDICTDLQRFQLVDVSDFIFGILVTRHP